ncbi:Two-component system response regulator [Synechococcus sp. RCC307]|nr:Two-component system response regulator [Synechococcus sp. RCC307]
MAPEAEQLRLLLVDDEPKLTEFLRMELEVEGYAVQIANDGASGLIALRGEPAPDLVLLDWNLPDFTGLDICRRIRSTGMSVPVLMLTGYDEVKDKVEALDAGVDDYLVKPFSIEELLARLRALQRRSNALQPQASEPDVLRIGDLELNQANHDVRRGSRSIQLSNKEYQLLVFLMRSPNKVQSRLEILHGVWGESFYGDDNLLDVYIRYLRQKVESPDEPKLIHTVRGVGFMMRLEEASS